MQRSRGEKGHAMFGALKAAWSGVGRGERGADRWRGVAGRCEAATVS